MITYACIAPHGLELIPSLAPASSLALFRKTREGMRALAADVARARPDTIILASPHNLRLQRRIGVVITENSSGTLSSTPSRLVKLHAKCNVSFARDLLNLAERHHLPVVGANYGTSEGEASDMPMDWGTLIPMWFLLKERRLRARLVLVTPSREIPLRQNVLFGMTIADLAEKRQGRQVFIASADQAHAHSKNGPYGFHRDAAKYDSLVQEAVQKNQLKDITRLDPKFVERAKPDSLWQMAMLVGILERVPLVGELVSYDAPTYYGMLCARFAKIQN